MVLHYNEYCDPAYFEMLASSIQLVHRHNRKANCQIWIILTDYTLAKKMIQLTEKN
jgi:hypothetical protein